MVMKAIYLFICQLFVLSSIMLAQPARVEIKTLKDYQLKGDVKQVIVNSGQEVLKFTKEGYLQYEGELDSLKRGITYTYDKVGRLLKYRMAMDIDNFQVKTYVYNMKGLLIKYIRDTEENKPYHETYQYDENGNICLQIGVSEKPMSEFRNTYDAQKRIIKIEELFPSSKRLAATTVITYLPNGWSKHVYTSSLEKVTSEYDSKGRMRSMTKRDLATDEIYLSITIRYDDNDNLIEFRQNEVQINKAYNELGELISEVRKKTTGGSDYVKSYSYTKHDVRGNWTERVVSNLTTNDKYTETRNITYYGKVDTPTTTNDPLDAFFGKGNFNIPNKGQFVASAPSVVAVGGQFRLNYTIGIDNIGNFKAPSFNNFEVLMGPGKSSSTSTEVIKNSVKSKFSTTYTFVLQAMKAGSFTIPGASVESEGKTYTSNAVTIKVTAN